MSDFYKYGHHCERCGAICSDESPLCEDCQEASLAEPEEYGLSEW
jgi:hypothetical protein